jgi:EAL domain-containing protein (putative c-di-GMP-specific phosphodiesterase class I)
MSTKDENPRPHGTCTACQINLNFDFTMAFQPIVESDTRTIFAHEALVRGRQNEPAAQILAQVNEQNRYRFDQDCRIKAIRLAAELGMQTHLSINFLPNAVYQPEACIQATLEIAQLAKFPREKLIFEITEGEKIDDHGHLLNIIRTYKQLGVKTAIDDFGAGYSGLNLLAEFQPDIIKLDMALIRNIHTDKVRQAIVKGSLEVARELACEVIAEGIEARQEMIVLRDLGIHFFQGYYFAKPAFQRLAPVGPNVFDT